MTAPETIGSADPADWVTIWQSELAALAVDRECAEALLLWGQAWVDAGDATPGRDDKPSRGRDDEPSRGCDDEPSRGCAGADAQAGASPAGAAPDAEWLRSRLAAFGRGG